MVKKTTAYADNQGVMHTTLRDAVSADMRYVMGKHVDNVAILTAVVEAVFKERADIERIFRELDDMNAPEVVDAK